MDALRNWIGVAVLRTIEVTWIFWVLLALTAYNGWGGANAWRDYFIPLCWVTLLAFAALLAFRKHEISK